MIRVFFFGDYEFLCRSFGLSGHSGKITLLKHSKLALPLGKYNANLYPLCTHSGRHCCLWCHITQEEMVIPRESRGLQLPRTLDTLQSDLQRFRSAGPNLKVAKEYNNVIGSVLFSVPLDQVNKRKICSELHSE